MRRFRRGFALFVALLVAAGTGGPAGSQPAVTVTREAFDLPGAPDAHTPPQLNRVGVFQYAAANAPATVLILIPGLNSGVNTLDLFARSLITAPGRPLEVWTVSLRSTLLQDRLGITTALAQGSPDYALAYYYGQLAIDGHTYHRVRDFSPAAFWGLDVHLRDIRAVVQEAHRRHPGAKIVLGGHSLGGILAALYAGYDFGRPPGPGPIRTLGGIPVPSADAGARDIDGLLLVDGVPLAFIPRLSPAGYLNGIRLPFVGRIPGVNNLLGTNGASRVGTFTDISGFARPEDSVLFDVIAVYAFLRPEEASRLPFRPRNGLAITNEALLGGILSSDMQRDLFVRASVGVPLGEFNRIPDPTGFNPSGLWDLQSGRPAPGERLIRWISAGQQSPRPRVDLRQLEEAIFQPGADFTQWYMPWRLFLDLGLAAQLDTSDAFASQFMSLTQLSYTKAPLLIIGAGWGLVRSTGTTLFYRSHIATPPSEVSLEIFRGYTHLDIEDAVPNPAVPRIRGWLESVIH